jgi:hypothetical protein
VVAELVSVCLNRLARVSERVHGVAGREERRLDAVALEDVEQARNPTAAPYSPRAIIAGEGLLNAPSQSFGRRSRRRG